MLLVPSGAGLVVQAASGLQFRLETMELAAAQWAYDNATPTGKGSGTLAASDWYFQPLRAGDNVQGVLGLARENGEDPLRPDQLPLLTSLVDQAALALERLRLEEEMRDLDVVRTRDRLRAALLSSVSHDLRTPLTAVDGGGGRTAPWRHPELDRDDRGRSRAAEPLRRQSARHGAASRPARST